MLEQVRLALRVTTTVFDSEIEHLIHAALQDLGIAGVIVPQDTDPLIVRAVTTYCKLHFGEPEHYERMKRSYDEQKAQLQMADGYTQWRDTDG